MDDETAQGNLGSELPPKTYRHIHTGEDGKVVRPLSRTDQGNDLTGKALDEELSRLYGVQKGHCAGCDYEYRFKDMTKDRIFPGKKGGRYVRGNIQLLCSNCNSKKGERPQEYLKASMARIEGQLDMYKQ